MEIFFSDDPKQALPVLDQMGICDYPGDRQEYDPHIQRSWMKAQLLNMELLKAGVSVRGIGITSEELKIIF